MLKEGVSFAFSTVTILNIISAKDHPGDPAEYLKQWIWLFKIFFLSFLQLIQSPEILQLLFYQGELLFLDIVCNNL